VLALTAGFLATVGAGTASAAVHTGITTPAAGSTVSWPISLNGGCQQIGPNETLLSCQVKVLKPGGTVVYDQTFGPNAGPNTYSFLFSYGTGGEECVEASLWSVSLHGVGTGGGTDDTINVFRVDCDGDGDSDGIPPTPPNQPPTVVMTTPPDGASYFVNDIVGADSGCFDSDGSIASCAKSAGANGTPLYTGHSGSYSSTTTATDDDGATATVTHSYTVVNRPPTANITSPPVPSLGPDGLKFYVGEAIPAHFTCADADGNLSSCVGNFADGANIDTTGPGGGNVHVVATDSEGATGTDDQPYDVYQRPEAEILSPANGTVFTPGQQPTPVFDPECRYGIVSSTCETTVQKWDAPSPSPLADGATVPTAYGEYTLRVKATDQRPTSASASGTVRANRPPVATVWNTPSSPTVNATGPQAAKRYFVGQTVLANYTCADTRDTDYIPVSIVSCVGNVPNGQPIDTATVGAKTFTVKAIDNDGGYHIITVPYTVHPVIGPCRGTALRLGTLVLGTANEPVNPCQVASKTDLIANVNSGGLLGPNPTVASGLLTGATSKGIGSQSATATVAGLKVNVAGITVGVDALVASAKSQLYDCDAPSVNTFTNQLGKLTLNGVPTPISVGPFTIDLILAKLKVGDVVTHAHDITVQPIMLDLPGFLPDLTIAEVIAGAECGPLP
jgi:hypothetical protein